MGHRAKRERDRADYGVCHYCEVKLGRRGDTAKTVDHIVPVSLGGRDERFNKVPACRKCNGDKGNSAPTCRCNKCRKAVRIHWEMYRVRVS